MEHYSVLLKESIDLLDIKEDGIYVDGTLGRGGHSSKIAEKLTTGHLYSFDKDEKAIEQSKLKLEKYADKVTFIHSDFRNIKNELLKRNVEQLDGFIFDLGVSSPQFDDPQRGFSYRFDSRLDMRMDQSQHFDAYQLVNEYDFHELVRIFKWYGEENFAKQIARNIEKMRAIKPIETTFELVEVIKAALPAKVKAKKGHPAKKVFQAIRIEVNKELEAVEIGVEDAVSMLKIEGKGAVISFHSLEDRIIKEIFNQHSRIEKVDKRIPVDPKDIPTPNFKLLTKKPILPSSIENDENNRSHSAKLRGIERIK